MKKFEVKLSVKDAETGITTDRNQPAVDLTQENLTEGVQKLAELEDLFKGLSDEDTISASIDITDDQDEMHNASVHFSNVKKKEIVEFGDMLNNAFRSLSEGSGSDTTTPPADETTTPPADETTTPPAEETTTPPAEETTTPPAEETTTAPAEETTTPPVDQQP